VNCDESVKNKPTEQKDEVKGESVADDNVSENSDHNDKKSDTKSEADDNESAHNGPTAFGDMQSEFADF